MEKALEVRMAVLDNTVTNLDKKVTDIQADVKAIILTLSKTPSLEAKILSLEAEILDLKKSSNYWRWASPALSALVSAILGSVLTFLIISYITNIK